MRSSVATAAAWLALLPLTFSAPLLPADSHLPTTTFSSLRRPQLDIPKARREAQLVVPYVFPSPSSQPTSSQSISLPPISDTLSHTRRQSIKHTMIQFNHIGEPVEDRGEEDNDQKASSGDGIDSAQASSETLIGEATKSSASTGQTSAASPEATPLYQGRTKRQEIPPPSQVVSKGEDQKGAEGKGIEGSKPPAETVKEENKRVGEIHGGCDEVYLARPIGPRKERSERSEGAESGVHWHCAEQKKATGPPLF